MPWVSYGQKGEGTKTSGSWQPYGTKKKQDKKKAIIEESLKQAEKYQAEAEKYAGRVDMIEGIGKTIVRPFVSLAEIPKNVYGSITGKQNTFGDVNVPGLGKVQSYQEEAKGVTGDILEGKKPLYSILKPIGSAVIDTAGLGIGSSVAKGVTKEAFKQTAKRLIPEGAAYGLGQGAVDSIGNGRTYGEKAKDIATSTAFGAVGAPLFGVGFNVIGRAVSSLGSKLSGRATKALDPKEVKSTVDEIVGIVDRDLKPEEEQMVMESLSRGATKEDIVTEVGKANIEAGFDPSIRLAQVVDELEAGGKKLSLDEIATVKKGMDEGKSFEEIQSTLEPQKALSTAPKEETGATVPKDTSDNGDEAFLKAVEERFKASKTNKFREATKDEKGRFTGSKSEARMKTGDPERDALSESIQTRIDNLGKDELNKTTEENFYDTSQRLKLEDIQNQIPKAKAEELPRLKEESDRIIKEILDKRAGEFKATSKKEDLIQKARTIANNSNSSLEFRTNLRKEGMGKAFKSQQAAEEFYRRMNGAKYRLADEDPLIQEAKPSQYERYKDTIIASQRTEKGIVNKIYADQKSRGNRTNRLSHGDVQYTKEELQNFLNKSGKFKPMYEDWVKSGYDPQLKPSIDRIDPKKGYSLDNIQLTTWGENLAKGRGEMRVTQGKPIIQTDAQGNVVKIHRSLSDAADEVGVNFKTISNAAIGKNGSKSAGGFTWRYAKPEEIPKDVYNQSAPNSLLNEARKYKSAEEFVNSKDGEKAFFGRVVDDIKSKLPNSELRITQNSIGVMKGNVRGNWMDNEDAWTFYPSKSIPEDFRVEVQKRIPGAKVMNGAIDFPKESFPSINQSKLTDIWKKAHGEKFRDIAPRFEELTGTKITPEQEAQIKSLHKRMFGDENVEITAQILTPEGQKAFGVYKNKVIKILDGQVDPTDTFYHEAVHKYLDLFTTLDEQKNIYLEARKLWKTDNLDELEEKIAENFIRYAKENEGVVGTMKVLFDKVIDRIKNALKGESSIEALYKDILEGKAKKAPLTSKELQKRTTDLQRSAREKEREMAVIRKGYMSEEKFLAESPELIFDEDVKGQYESFVGLLRRFRTGRQREAILSGDVGSIKKALDGKVGAREIDDMFYSQEKSDNEMLDYFRGIYEKGKKKVTEQELLSSVESKLKTDPDYIRLQDELGDIRKQQENLARDEEASIKSVNESLNDVKKEVEPIQKTKEATLDNSVKQIVPKGKKVSIIASRLNKDLPPDFRIDETYDPKAINKEADRAAELIAENKTKAIQKALDTGTNPMERDAILIELSEIAKRDKDYGTLNDLFNKRSELIRSGAQSLNMEKASILLNPQEQYMRNVVNAKLGKVKISGKDLTPETLAAKRTGIRKETKDVVRRSFKIEDAQELFDKLLCK